MNLGHLLGSFKLDSGTSTVPSATYVTLTSSGIGASDGRNGRGVRVFNGGSQPLSLYSGVNGVGGLLCSIAPEGQDITLSCCIPAGPLSLKSDNVDQTNGIIKVDVFG